MALTKLQARTMIQQFADDPSGKQWSATNLDLLTQLVLDEKWGELLDFAPGLLSALDTVVEADITAPGYIDLSSAGPLSQRFYRAQQLTRDSHVLHAATSLNFAAQSNEEVAREASDYSYFVRGGELWMLPLDDSTEVEVRYSYLPPLFTSLADGDSVVWPDGFEGAFILEAAGRAMLKGGREDASELLGMAARTFQRLLARVERNGPGPIMPFVLTTPTEWGGM